MTLVPEVEEHAEPLLASVTVPSPQHDLHLALVASTQVLHEA